MHQPQRNSEVRAEKLFARLNRQLARGARRTNSWRGYRMRNPHKVFATSSVAAYLRGSRGSI